METDYTAAKAKIAGNVRVLNLALDNLLIDVKGQLAGGGTSAMVGLINDARWFVDTVASVLVDEE